MIGLDLLVYKRSYALTPVYEAATRPIEESPPVNSGKVEPDDSDGKEACQPDSLIDEASTASSASSAIK
ncbi:hypothetical protein LOK49_LG02G00870 [Camellia lanceoleosa]|uniref:Uncharacterized protein n=1 Tax=Camellia lanceoleosa TaxID=1840588 RepID=A0ACC0IP38_9ERIC|nr:hypothetical protein LOK49_LG02G00870 [Camellia lanceoleosa]